jgi:hypothetical protein
LSCNEEKGNAAGMDYKAAGMDSRRTESDEARTLEEAGAENIQSHSSSHPKI